MPTTNNHPVNVGCVLSAPFGWHNLARMIAVATDLGYVISDDEQAIVDRYEAGDSDPDSNDHEVVIEMMDDAEAWLNEHTDDGYLWHWSDGEFFLSPFCGDECDDEMCACWSFR